MSDVVPSTDFGVSFPANARMTSMSFAPGELHVTLEDGGSERIIAAPAITAIHGAAIRRDEVHPAPLQGASIVERVLGKEGLAVNEGLQYVVAIRASSVGEFWYLVADTFNFRKSLGAEAGLVLDQNLRTLLRTLTKLAPQAVLDSFVTAMLADIPLPPPLGGLMEFFKVVAH